MTDTCPPTASRSPLDAVFAGLYDPIMARMEARGLGQWRRDLLASLHGRVLEIGAGTGANLPYYPAGVELTLSEPIPAMRRRLVHKGATVVPAAAEALPFDDRTFDAVVATLVLCSVRDLDRAVGEIWRVLRPGGRFVFIEHVGATRPWVCRLQHLLEPPWKVVARGCHLTRLPDIAMTRAGFHLEVLDRIRLPGGTLIVDDAIRGIARRPLP